MVSIPFLFKASLLASTLLAPLNVLGIDKITRSGRYLYDSQNRFYIKGVAYQPQGAVDDTDDNAFLEPSTFVDPLSSSSNCTRDLPFLQQLGVNTVRVYSVDSSLNHDGCMSTFSNAGIYTIIDLSLPLNGSIDRAQPTWSTNLLDEYLETINTFSKYDNVLMYNIGNEVVTAPNETAALSFIKAAARDVKSYLNAHSLPQLVGYAAIDGADNFTAPLAEFLSCDPSNDNSGSTAIDVFGLNNYRWCGESTFEEAYAGVENLFAEYNVAAYFSEFGCNTVSPRIWQEVGALFSSEMSDVWSGGLAFSYFPAESTQGEFGMVTINSDNSVTTSTDFNNLKTQYSNASGPNSPSPNSATTFPACPAQNETMLASESLPPTPVDSGCECVATSVSCQFTPKLDPNVIAGELINEACGLLGNAGGNCNDIASNGSAGSYGSVSACDPSTKLSYVFSLFYEATNKASTSCDFAGNATVNSSNRLTAASAASSCLANDESTSVPVSPSNSSSGSSSSGSSTQSSAVTMGVIDPKGILAVVATIIASGLWILA